MASGTSSAASGSRSGPLDLALLLARGQAQSAQALLDSAHTLLELDSVHVELAAGSLAPALQPVEAELRSSGVRKLTSLQIGRLEPAGHLNVAASRADFPTADERAVLQLVADQLALLFLEQRVRTERVRVAEARAASEQSERVERALLLSELTSVLAHDVNQPLAAIVTNANACRRWLAAGPPNLEEARAAAERIAHEGSRASQVVQQIRAKLRGDEGHSEPLRIEHAFAQLQRALRDELTTSGITLQIADTHALPEVCADRTQLHHVLLNLAHNALEAMRGVSSRAHVLSLSAELAGADELQIHVRDSGPGLGEDRQAAFRALYSTKPNGLGLGLSVSRSLVRALGGRLWATANAEGGETFSFTLPHVSAQS